MSHALLCFASTFVAVFALGLQSLNVNQGHYLAAAGTSVLISAGHIGLYKFMPDAELLQVAAYFAGGITGICSSMWFHRTVRAWWQDRKAIVRRGPPRPIPQCKPRPGSPGYPGDEHASSIYTDQH